MKNFFLKHFLRQQTDIHLLIIESTAVKIFKKEKAAMLEAIFSKSVLIEKKKRPRNKTQQHKYLSYTLLSHLMTKIASICTKKLSKCVEKHFLGVGCEFHLLTTFYMPTKCLKKDEFCRKYYKKKIIKTHQPLAWVCHSSALWSRLINSLGTPIGYRRERLNTHVAKAIVNLTIFAQKNKRHEFIKEITSA